MPVAAAAERRARSLAAQRWGSALPACGAERVDGSGGAGAATGDAGMAPATSDVQALQIRSTA